jgi:hypothetical protein
VRSSSMIATRATRGASCVTESTNAFAHGRDRPLERCRRS